MVAAKTGNENGILDILHMTVQKSLAYIEGILYLFYILLDYCKSEITALIHRFMGKLWCTVKGRSQTTSNFSTIAKGIRQNKLRVGLAKDKTEKCAPLYPLFSLIPVLSVFTESGGISSRLLFTHRLGISRGRKRRN